MTKADESEKPKFQKPGLMYYVLMVVAIGCVIYGVYGWVTGKW
ncbi:MAG TPA: hypothetical protein O0W79_05180 [Methanocorpusculum sp.]|nr:hypothetical protein [Methanocorpusculum sp.]HJJ95944.1 hypothetical protein [Methanocorpusculum sp.]